MSELAKYTRDLPDSTVDELKLVLVNMAKSNISRLYMLSNSLEMVEHKIIERSYDENISLSELIDIYSIIRKSVTDVVSLIQQITTDPTIISIIVQNNQIIQNTTNNTNNIEMLDKNSREKIRLALSSILDNTNKVIEEEVISNE